MKTLLSACFASLTILAASAQAALIINAPVPITHKVQVQPIVVQQAAAQGGATATYFGTPTQQASIESLIDSIWAQVGIDIEFLPTTTYVDSFAYNGFPVDYTTGPPTRPTSDLNAINSAAGAPPKSANTAVLNMFFVDIVPGFNFTSSFTANGLAFVDANGVTQFVGASLPGSLGGREVIASVVAHEIGHNLGLPHIVSPENLMQASGSPMQGERLGPSDLATIMEDGPGLDGFELLQPIPEPAGAVLALLALGVLGLRRRR